MPDIVQLLEMLQSTDPNKRYDACEELRVAHSIPEEALAALRKAIHDPDPYVIEAATRALAAHSPGAPAAAAEKKPIGPERRRAKAPYSRLRFSPLVTVFTFAVFFSIVNTSQTGPSNFYIAAFGAILVSALWHLLLIQYIRNSNSDFVRWHGRQALLLAGIRTLTCLIFLGLDAAAGGSGLIFFWVIPVLIAMWLIMTPWGNGQVERGECALANWMGQKMEIAEDIMDEGPGPKKEAQAQNKKGSTGLPVDVRRTILTEIYDWEKEGLIQPVQAAALRKRYEIEAPPSAAPEPAPAKPASVPVTLRPVPTPARSAQVSPMPTPVAQAAKPAAPARSQLTLTERLLSQTSINIFLYLGAFLVIGSALILAALVEATRIPILLAATLIFGAGAGVIKKRLPQPSITLFVVFSCLLPIDANVIAQSIHITGQTANAYWAAVFFFMALIWGLATWFYSSRIFSILAFGALGLALLRFSEIFNTSLEWNALSGGVSALLGLLGVQVLKDWKDNKFAQPLFIAAQIVQGLALLASFGFVSYNLLAPMLGSPASGVQGFASALTWIGAAAFYAWSELLFPFMLFPWAAAGSLLPVSWLVLKTFNASNPAQITGLFVWGALLAFASEYFVRRDSPKVKEYYLPLLLGSVPVLLGAALWGLNENISDGFACLVGIAIIYALLMSVRPRQLVWAGALLAALGGYFTFFHLPAMQNVNILSQYQLLGAAVLLAVPELFFKSELTSSKAWRWPPFLFGIIFMFINFVSATSYLSPDVIISDANGTAGSLSGQTEAAAIVFGVYALLFAAYALHLRRPLIGYLATASAALAVVFALQHFNLDQWLPVLSGLALLYFIAGCILRGEKGAWGSMLRISGLTLGALIAFIALFSLKATSGWYVLLTGGLFMVETYLRPEGRIEASGPAFFSAGAFLILRDLHIDQVTYNLLILSLIWLAADMLYARTLRQRRMAQLTRYIGGGIAALNAFIMLSQVLVNVLGLDVAPGTKESAIVFGVYAVFFAIQAWFYQKPRLGYAATASLALAIPFALQYFQRDLWLPILTGLALAYYAVGYFLRAKKTPDWSSMLRYSGLTVGTLVSLFALFTLKHTGGWYVLVIGVLFMVEMYLHPEDRMEASGPVFFSAGTFLILRDLFINNLTYNLLAISLIWLAADMLYARTLKQRRLAQLTRFIGGGVAALTVIVMLSPTLINATGLEVSVETKEPAIGFGVYAVFFAIQAWFYQKPRLGYTATGSLALSIPFALQYFQRDLWLPILTGLALAYYAAGYFLRAIKTPDWSSMLRYSGLTVGTLVSLFALFTLKHTGGWYVLAIGILFMIETYLGREDRMEIGAPILFNIAAFLILRDLNVNDIPYHLLATSLIWLGVDGLYARTLKHRRLGMVTKLIGGSVAFGNAVLLISPLVEPKPAAICFGVYAVFFVLYAWVQRKPILGYAATVSLPLSMFFLLRVLNQDNWLYEIAGIAVIYYAAGYSLRRGEKGGEWGQMLVLSGLGLGVINSVSAVLQTGLGAAIPVAMAATLFAAEAFAQRNVWLGFPANLLYLEAYFLILVWLKVDQPQFFSVGTALLGMLMHYLLTRAGSKTGAFLTGMFSQLVLLGTTFIQMYSTQQLSFFVVIFLEALAVLGYGIVARSRSLIIAPIIFIVLSVFTVLYTALKGISTVILIGGTGLILLLFGISAVVLRERITKISERFSGWNA